MRAPTRLDTSYLAHWWWSIDRASLMLVGALMTVGIVLMLAAGPGTAARLNIANEFHFPLRQAFFVAPAVILMIGASMLKPLHARRVGVILFGVALTTAIIVLLFAPPVNGAHRWLDLGPFGFQPSELLKPGFIITAAWMLAEGARNPTFPGAAIAMGLFAIASALLVLQPDYGQAALLTAVWMIMFFIAGWSILWLVSIAGVGAAVMGFGYFFSDHLARRIDGYVATDCTNRADFDANFQICTASQAIAHGGLSGRGADLATVKLSLPDAHADFIFAVAAEQYGFLLCLLIMALFGVFVVRIFLKAIPLKSVFAQCAACGLAASIGLQAFINMAVAMRALPAKGMTLPFISYGGSSLMASALTVGLMLALTRRHEPARRRREIMP